MARNRRFAGQQPNGALHTFVIVEKIIIHQIALGSVATPNPTIALDTIEARQDILRSFFAEIGLRMVKDKRGNMIADEVSSSDMLLMFNISDMLKCRQAAAKNISECFGLNISVKLSPEFDVLKAGMTEETLDTDFDGDN